MSKKNYIAIISLLLLIIIGQAFLLYKNKRSTNLNNDDEILKKPRNSHSLLHTLREKFDKDNESTRDIFDHFFDDDFFNTQNDPFRGMEKMREKLYKNFLKYYQLREMWM